MDALLNLGRVLVEQQRYGEALPVLRRFLERAPTHPHAEAVQTLIAQLEDRGAQDDG